VMRRPGLALSFPGRAAGRASRSRLVRTADCEPPTAHLLDRLLAVDRRA
jgi:hypothetical protein